jgi:hypothetical protein
MSRTTALSMRVIAQIASRDGEMALTITRSGHDYRGIWPQVKHFRPRFETCSADLQEVCGPVMSSRMRMPMASDAAVSIGHSSGREEMGARLQRRAHVGDG